MLLPAAVAVVVGFADMKAIDMGVVTATVEFSGKRQTVGRTVLKHKRVPLRFSTLMYHLNKLLAAYDDPLDIVRVAQDLATRCKTPEQPQPEQRKKRIVRIQTSAANTGVESRFSTHTTSGCW